MLTIDLQALAANYRLLNARVATGVSIKADAYGLGAAHIASALEAAGCQTYFVATADEGLALRPIIKGDIYVFSGLVPQGAGLIPVLNSLADIERFKGGACAVFFDTGMNRLGLGADETARVIQNPTLLKHCNIRLFLSHFACSEDSNHPMNITQCTQIDRIKNALAPFFPSAQWSMCNSSGVFHYPQAHYDLARCGYAVYGGNPTPNAPNPMHPVVQLDVPILQIRHVRAGETIGYSATHRFEADSITATVQMGYADGFARAHQLGQTPLYWRGLPCPVLGRVSMDYVTVGLGHIQGQKPQAGDSLEVLGDAQDIDALARSANTIGYAILTSLGKRYQRRYIGGL
jgi:alanine racemase